MGVGVCFRERQKAHVQGFVAKWDRACVCVSERVKVRKHVCVCVYFKIREKKNMCVYVSVYV